MTQGADGQCRPVGGHVRPVMVPTTDNQAEGLDAEHVRRQLLAEITSGRLPVGAKVGSERQLAGALGVSRAVVRQVLAGLASAGLVRRVTGRAGGTFVSRLRVDHHANALQCTRRMVAEQGMSHDCRVLEALSRPGDHHECQALEIADGAAVIALVRLQLADGAPLSLERIVLSAERFPGMLGTDLSAIHDVACNRYGTRLHRKDEQVEVVVATADEAARLQVPPGSPLMAVSTVNRCESGRPIDYAYAVYRADRTRIVVSGQR